MNIDEIVNDFSRRYQETYVLVKFPDEEKENVFHVDRVAGDDDHCAVLQLSSDEFGSIKLNLGTTHEIGFRYPAVDTFQHGKDAVYFQRVPARQYRRGLCNGNAAFFLPVKSIIACGVTWDWKLINDAFNPQKYTFDQACQMLASGKYRGVALTAQGYSVLLSLAGDSEYWIFFFDLPVARYNSKNKAVTMVEKSFANQIKDIVGYAHAA